MAKLSLGQRIKNYLGNAWDEIGVSLHASARQGAKELAQILPAFPDSVRPVEELGTMGNPTQLEVNREKGNDNYHGVSETRSHVVEAPKQQTEQMKEREM